MSESEERVPRRSFDPRSLVDGGGDRPSLFDKGRCLTCARWVETGGTCPEREDSPCRGMVARPERV